MAYYNLSALISKFLKEGTLTEEEKAAIRADIGATQSIEFDPSITGLTGGTSVKLDAVPTVDLPAGHYRFVYYGGGIGLYELKAGSADENNPEVIVPDDYDEETNEKYWFLQRLHANVLQTLRTIQFRYGMLTAPNTDYTFYTLPVGTDEVVPGLYNATIPVLKSFVDATAANAVVSVGDAWWDNTLKKVRVRLS